MSLPASLPASAVNMVIGMLLPLILPGVDGDVQEARDLALHLLWEYQPQTGRELQLAGEAVGCSLRGLAMLAQSAEPGIRSDKLEMSLKWACSLSRSGHQAQRRLNELQRTARAGRREDPAPAPEQAAPTATPAYPTPESVAEPEPPPAAETAPPSDLAQAEAKLRSAVKLLNLMQGQHKGAPEPHSQAAQQIQAQQRSVETARLTLQQARQADQAQPEPVRAAA